MSFSLKADMMTHSGRLLSDLHLEHHTWMCDSISWRNVWTLPVTVHGPCLWQVHCSAKIKSHLFISRTPNSWWFLKKGQQFPYLSYILPPRHMSVLCQRMRDASSGVCEWCQFSYRAFSERCRQAKKLTIPRTMPTHHIIYTAQSAALQLSQLCAVVKGKKEKKWMMSSFQ